MLRARRPLVGSPPLGEAARRSVAYLRWFEMRLVISNIVTFALPSTDLSFSSALIMRLLTASWSLFFLM